MPGPSVQAAPFSAPPVLTLHPEAAHFRPPCSAHFLSLFQPSPRPSIYSSPVDPPSGRVDSWMALCLTRVLAGGSTPPHTHTHTRRHTPANAHAYTQLISTVSNLLSCEAPITNSVCVCGPIVRQTACSAHTPKHTHSCSFL